ncbi:hypothetical protein DTO013E5_8849 [Penicillium roqueforti]|uniref:uncharacterized protein n=1 Tax=Penicillium roqueforti TaxID=5082 RepID=UPI00190B5DFD|nr:uncharacterized protein LCP9604111_7128 [Penicillium roqueforti]KAF9244736.1 hypothetical protein LCP9604111_7128 [Penicillium roqueforti]KAI1831243.1 hypothetical protein CBS147337_8001 [Penicillium roqueforti]KAI2680988.1 hypothetical protein LCP963914a_6939 [Penicillium roqueforti]KAI2690647.1 hypothetical protein CBS147355_1098 [Penicillium roqueforti]KAI2698210.1 hypothetical protein CBS147372_7228 [Penicillium roqueforti]
MAKKSAKRRLTQRVADLTGAPGVKLTARSSSLDHYSPSPSLIICLLVILLLSLIPQTWRFFWAAMRGPTVLKAEDDKTRQLNKNTLMAFSGESGDTVQFAEYIQANAALYSMRNDTELSPSAVANFVRGELARSLRSRSPYTVNLLLGGIDPVTEKPHLYWIDYLASLAPLPYAAHGYAQYYCLSILDKHHHPDCSLEEGLALLTLCTDELKRRLPFDYKGMLVKVVTKDGVQEVPVDNDKVVRSA